MPIKLLNLSKNNYLVNFVKVFLLLYASFARPSLPDFLKDIMKNPLVKILILTLVLYIGNKDPQISLLIAVAFVITMNMLSEQELLEDFRQIEGFRQMKNIKNKHSKEQ